MKKIKIIAFICSVIFAVSMIAACGSSSGRTSNSQTGVSDVLQAGIEEAQKTENNESEVSTETEESSDISQKEETDDKSAEKQFSEITETTEPETLERAEVLSTTPGIDIDLTELSSTMVYSEVYNMLLYPDEYIGKVVKMKGVSASYHDEATGEDYYACIIKDATACCAQGIEFELTDEYDYPADDEEVTVVGVFDKYQEEPYTYITLRNATLVQ